MNKHLLLTTLVCAITTILSASDVVMTAKEHGYTAFHDAVHAADLYKHAKKAEGDDGSMAPFTVFVPTNEAFERIASLDADKKKGIITFHVAPGQKVASLDEMPDGGIGTVGEELLDTDGTTVGLADSSVRAKVVKGPIEANNGVLYVIDTILTPEGMTLPEAETEAEPAAMKPAPAPIEPVAPTPPPVKKPSSNAAQELTQPLAHVAQALPTAVAAAPTAQHKELLNAMTNLTQSIQLLTQLLQHYGQKQDVVVEHVPVGTSMAIPGLK